MGVMYPKAKRPVRAKAFIINAFALTGRIIYNIRLPRAFLLRQAAEPSGPGLGEIWAFSPHCLSFDTPSYCLWLIILLFILNHIILYG